MALITLPLAFQLGISAILLGQLSASEQKLEKRISRMRIVASLDEVQRLHVRCLAAAAFYSVSRDEEIGKKHIAGLKQLAAELKELKQLTGDQPELLQRTTDLQKAIIAVVPYEMMMRKFSIVESALQVGPAMKARQLIKDSMHLIQDYQSTFMAPAGDTSSFQRASRELQLELAALLVAVVAGTIALLYWSQRSVVSGVDLLLSQIDRFQKGCMLSPMLAGKDELGKLEKVLCDTANGITRREEFRQELSAVVSHDIRAPMTSIAGVVSLIEAGALGAIGKSQEELIRSLKGHCADLIALINDILDLDKLRSGKWNMTVTETACDDLRACLEEALLNADCGSVDVHAESGSLSCDPDSLTRAVISLVQTFAGEESSVTVRVSAETGLRVAITRGATPSGSRETRTLSLVQNLCLGQSLEMTREGDGADLAFLLKEKPGDRNDSSDLSGLSGLSGMPDLSRQSGLPDLSRQSDLSDLSRLSDLSGQSDLSDLSGQSGLSDLSESSARFSRSGGLSNLGKTLLILIGRSMAVSATAVLLLGVLINQVDQEIAGELRSREIIQHTTRLSSGVTHLMLLSLRRIPGDSAEETKARERTKKQIDADLAALVTLENASRVEAPEELQQVQEKVEEMKRIAYALAAAAPDELADSAPQLAATMKKMLESGKLSSATFTKAGGLLAELAELDSMHAQRIAELRGNVLKVLAGASVLVAVLTGLGALRVWKDVLSRLRNIEENAGRLSRRQELRQAAISDKGRADFELAYLDTFFFEAARSIARLEKERQELSSLLREDLKEPLLSVAAGFTSLVETGDLNEKGQRMIRKALPEIRRLSDLADDLLVLNSLKDDGSVALEVEIRKVSTREIVGTSVDAVRAMAELKDIEIIVRDDSSFDILADPDRSIQILVNLLSNAVKFSPEQSRIEIKEEKTDGMVKLIVSDRGRGISEEDAHKIFARFDQIATEDRSKGSGLGLFISKKLAEAQSGRLDFSSQVGSGSKFWLELPEARTD